MSELNKQITIATKWSAITEIISRLITPVSSMLLARLLTPEAFGVVATLTMIITFAEIFTDAGFQKYLIQHEFLDDKDRVQSTNVAFWSNLILSLIIWIGIAIFCEPLATLVGNPGLGQVLTIACVSIPLAAFSSIQMALYKRDFDFKTLFKVRIVGICIPLFVTIPLAFWLKSHWALVIGTISGNLANAVLLTYYSKWKPTLFYSFHKLKEMLSFTVWSMFESISIWLTVYIDIFIVGVCLNEYYLGLYKTSTTIVGQITGLITAATTPIIFSSLSRLQSDEVEFKRMFFKFQRQTALFVVPIGVGIFCFSDLVTTILLGNQWLEASGFVGFWGLMSAITIVLAHYSSEVYRSKGKPKLSVLAQWLHMVVLYPVVLIAAKYGFEVLYISRSLVRLELVLVNLIIMYWLVKISPISMIKNVSIPFIAATGMYFVSLLLNISDSIIWQISTIILCSVTYIAIVCCFKQERKLLLSFVSKIKSRK